MVFTTDHFSDRVLDFEDVPSATSLLAVLLAVLVSTILIVAIVKRIE